MDIATIYKLFPTEEDCIAHLERIRWHGKPTCPYCQSVRTTAVLGKRRHHCNSCNTTFSVTVATIFHHTHLPLQKWFLALAIILNAKKGGSALQLSRDLAVNKNTAWYLAMRIRKAMVDSKQRELLEGVVEMDETCIGGKPRKGSNKGDSRKPGRGTSKTPIVGLVERSGDVKCGVVKSRKLLARTLNALVRKHVDTDKSVMITDEWTGYMQLSKFVSHEVVNHKVWYVDDHRHTNTMGCFWSLLRRGIAGQYHKVSIKHLDKYIDEFSYRPTTRATMIFSA